MTMTPHTSEDWCHLCGERSGNTVDINYADNAEAGGKLKNYIRICRECGELIARTSFNKEMAEVPS